MRRTVLATVAAAVLVVACGSDDGGGPGLEAVDATAADSATYEFVIPEGAGEALDEGVPLEVLPGELEVTVGETIRIVNEDERGHLVGPWFVGAGETVTQEFSSPGEFEGECTVHPSGQLVLSVREA